MHSAEIGHAIVSALLDVEAPVKGVTTGSIRDELKQIGSIAREGGGSLDPEAGGLDVTAGWGHAGKGGAVMPGKGKLLERDYAAKERESDRRRRRARSASLENDAFKLIGERTLDVYLNDLAYWKNIPAPRLGIHHRRLPGNQEMAELSRARNPRPRAQDGRSARRHRYRAPHRRDPPDGAGVGCQLRGGEKIPPLK